jgi:hypothetical protein
VDVRAEIGRLIRFAGLFAGRFACRACLLTVVDRPLCGCSSLAPDAQPLWRRFHTCGASAGLPALMRPATFMYAIHHVMALRGKTVVIGQLSTFHRF